MDTGQDRLSLMWNGKLWKKMRVKMGEMRREKLLKLRRVKLKKVRRNLVTDLGCHVYEYGDRCPTGARPSEPPYIRAPRAARGLGRARGAHWAFRISQDTMVHQGRPGESSGAHWMSRISKDTRRGLGRARGAHWTSRISKDTRGGLGRAQELTGRLR